MSKLITLEEFKDKVAKEPIDIKNYWNKDLFSCPRCGEGVKRDFSVAYMTNPPKYRYYCRSCNWSNIF
jgi:late competence protein required for DNA uptake (superfamily II DNA/RNA helicase)